MPDQSDRDSGRDHRGPLADFFEPGSRWAHGAAPIMGAPGWSWLGGPVPEGSAIATIDQDPTRITRAVQAMLAELGLPLDTPVAIGPTVKGA